MPPETDSESLPGAQNPSCTMQGKDTPCIFKSSLLQVCFSTFEICSLKAISDSSLSPANSKQAIRVIQLHHGSYIFPRISSMTGWQAMPNADFCKGNH